jgi:hypothetical protein
MKKFVISMALLLLAACATVPPKNTDNLCAVFQEKSRWYGHAQHSFGRWGIPVAVQMAIMHQESHFVADARPPRQWWLGFIPLGRPSTAYGYAQALDGTWQEYIKNTANWAAERDNFADAVDFIGWYCQGSNDYLGIAKWDTKNLYLAYHEGKRGFERKSYLAKPWLLQVADKVARQATVFQAQLTSCGRH